MLYNFVCPYLATSQFNGPIPHTIWELSSQVRTHDLTKSCPLLTLLIEIFHLGLEKTKGKTYLALGPRISPEEMARTFTRITGKQAVHSPISFEEFGDLSSKLVGPAFKEDAIEMMQWASVAPDDKTCYGAFEIGRERLSEELGLSGSSFGDWLRRSGWTGPENS